MPVKTFKSRFKTVDDAVDFLLETQARTAESQAKTDLAIQKLTDSQAKTDAKNAEYLEKIEKEIAESQARTAELQAKTAKSQAETDLAIKKLTKSQAETGLAIRELSNNLQKSIEETREEIKGLSRRVELVNTGLGTIGERFGKLIEFIVIPGIRPEMEKYGHHFKYATANKKFYYITPKKKDKLVELDLFLRNSEKAMAVEVKTTLSTGDVDGHLEKMKKLRKYETITNLKGKKLYGAMIGVFIDYYTQKYALERGLYVIEILEQEQKLKIASPTKVRVW